jgi:hypothetical protein
VGQGEGVPGAARLDLDVEAFLPEVFLDDADGARVRVVGGEVVDRVNYDHGEVLPPRRWCPGGIRGWRRAVGGVTEVALYMVEADAVGVTAVDVGAVGIHTVPERGRGFPDAHLATEAACDQINHIRAGARKTVIDAKGDPRAVRAGKCGSERSGAASA